MRTKPWNAVASSLFFCLWPQLAGERLYPGRLSCWLAGWLVGWDADDHLTRIMNKREQRRPLSTQVGLIDVQRCRSLRQWDNCFVSIFLSSSSFPLIQQVCVHLKPFVFSCRHKAQSSFNGKMLMFVVLVLELYTLFLYFFSVTVCTLSNF